MKIYKEKYASFASGSSSNKQKISTKNRALQRKILQCKKMLQGKRIILQSLLNLKKRLRKKACLLE